MLNLKKNKNSIKTSEYKNFGVLRLLTIIITGFLLTILGATCFFLYQKIYLSIGTADYIMSLESNLGIEPINFQLNEKVEKNWQKKYTARIPENIRDPFNTVIKEEDKQEN